MRFNTLGTFEVTHEDRVLTPTAPKQRSVLALLVLCHGGLVPVTSLIEEIWPENPPASALTTLQTYIYQLRKLFCAAGNSHDGVLVTKPLGYLARIAPGSVDSDEFDQLAGDAKHALEAADPLRASQLLHRATALWRGDALCDVQRGPLLDAHAAKLNEAWLQALAMRVEADLQIGRHHELVGELRGLIAKYPLHEDLYAKLMLALYRCDRRSQALQVYHEVRRCLDDELGIDPSPTLQQLHQNVLSDSPSLRRVAPAVRAGTVAAPAPNIVQAQLPADLSDFTGRAAELAELDRLLTPEGAAGRTFAVTGMTGVGKTVLAVRAAHAARSRFPDGQLFAEFDRFTEPVDVLGGFLTDLGVRAADLPEGEAERAKLFRTRTAGGCGLILLDGVSSAAQIRPLLPGGRWVVLATGRRLTGSLPGVVPMLLEPMSTDDGVALMSKVVTSRNILHERGTVAAVVHRCGGLPVALRALGERLSVNRHWPVTKLAARVTDHDGLRPELQAAGVDLDGPFREDLADLEPRDRQVLTRLCESGLDCFTAKNAVAVVEVSEREAEDALDRLVAANMLRVRVQADGPEFHYSLPPLFLDFFDRADRPSSLLQVVTAIPREAEAGIAVPG
ncbi:BTAD domain-containing putative transcriptional regulator [Amycolatopsis sp. NPDC051758]|uniref:AfsR/SARP family transcriptional regulator n=1 Tax=Amycolatopsis sp. NPDC051758 TaxID=3363935 RepID=UPI0037B177A6